MAAQPLVFALLHPDDGIVLPIVISSRNSHDCAGSRMDLCRLANDQHRSERASLPSLHRQAVSEPLPMMVASSK